MSNERNSVVKDVYAPVLLVKREIYVFVEFVFVGCGKSKVMTLELCSVTIMVTSTVGFICGRDGLASVLPLNFQ